MAHNEKKHILIKHAVDHVMSKFGLKVGLHMHPDVVWPCEGGVDTACLQTGTGISPVVRQSSGGLVPGGLAPTCRSGDPYGMNGGR